MCYLDRANIGNANVAQPSISESLGLSCKAPPAGTVARGSDV